MCDVWNDLSFKINLGIPTGIINLRSTNKQCWIPTSFKCQEKWLSCIDYSTKDTERKIEQSPNH